MFWRDEHFDAARGPRLSTNEALAFEREHPLVDRRRADLEVSLHVGFGGRAAEHAGIRVDEGQILALLGSEAGLCGLWTRLGYLIHLLCLDSQGGWDECTV